MTLGHLHKEILRLLAEHGEGITDHEVLIIDGEGRELPADLVVLQDEKQAIVIT